MVISMIYLDYSATTPVDEDVLESFNKVCREFPGNPNSLHKLGVKSKQLEESATKQIAEIMNVKPTEIIYTSGSSESNNLAIKGIALKYLNRGKKIITTNLEHSSIYGPIGYLQKLGFEVEFVKTNKDGVVDVNYLESMIDDDVILVTISAVNSETGLVQPIERIAEMLSNKKCFFHVDATQCVGKVKMNFKKVDLISFSAHKFYGIKGVGCLIKKDEVNLEPLIHGGKSTTKWRSGTPALPLIASMSKALRLADLSIQDNYDHVKRLKIRLIDELSKYEGVSINSNEYCLPHVLNLSVMFAKPETFQHALEEYDIYISTQSACSTSSVSRAVLELTKDEEKAEHSIRISLSGRTTNEEIDKFLEAFDICYHNLNLR